MRRFLRKSGGFGGGVVAGVGGREKDVNKGGGLGPLYALPRARRRAAPRCGGFRARWARGAAASEESAGGCAARSGRGARAPRLAPDGSWARDSWNSLPPRSSWACATSTGWTALAIASGARRAALGAGKRTSGGHLLIANRRIISINDFQALWHFGSLV